MTKLRQCINLILLVVLLGSCTGAAEQNNTGNSLSSALDFDNAVSAYTSAQVSDPDNPIPYLNSARAYFEQGNTDLAIEVLEQAILRGDDKVKAQAYYNMGNFYFMSQQVDNAILAYREALLINPDDRNARQNLELAMSYGATPTPFDDQMKTEPTESQINPSVSPTNEPLNNDSLTPTPTFQEVVFPERTPAGGVEGDHFGNQGPITPRPGETATLPVNEAGEILDKNKSDDESLHKQFSDEIATPTNSEGKKGW